VFSRGFTDVRRIEMKKLIKLAIIAGFAVTAGGAALIHRAPLGQKTRSRGPDSGEREHRKDSPHNYQRSGRHAFIQKKAFEGSDRIDCRLC